MKINFNSIANSAKSALSTTKFKVDCKKPEILIVAGIAAGIASTIVAVKATPKALEIKQKAEEDLAVVQECLEDETKPEYTEEDAKNDIRIINTQKYVGFIKVYAPSIIAGGLAIVSILGSHNIMIKRNTALAAAATVAEQAFKEYRERVTEKFGEETERDLYYGVEEDTIEETTVNKKGKEKTVQKKVKKIDSNKLNEYSKIFDETNQSWVNDASHNLVFLKQQQSYWNDILRTRGYVFLNEVYESLGFAKTIAGQEMGWVYDKKDPNCDTCIDFDIFDLLDPNKRYFINGLEKSIILNFNVDSKPIRYALVKKGLMANA